MRQQDLGMVTAYAYAVSQGYTGTEEEFAELMASYATVAERAEAAATAAETAQGKAEDAQTAAEGAQTAAETAQGKAEDAQGYAEAAETAAETAQGKAEGAQTAAEGAQTAAETAQGKAETAQGKAEDAQTAAETAQGYAEGYATAASGSASTASTQALKSEGYAVGTQDGTPVASGSPYYENNSKYYADEAAAVAASIPEDYSELTEDVSNLQSALKHTDNELFDYSYTPSSMVWESGSIYASSGTNLASSTRIRTATAKLLPDDVIGIQVVNGYKVSIYAWQSDNTYVGIWQGGTFAKTPKFLTGFIFVADLVKTYKYRLVLGKTDDSAMTTADYTGCLVARSKFLTVNANIGHVYQSGAIVPILDQLAIKTKNVFDSFTINAGSYSFVVGESTVANYRDYAASSSVSKNTPPIRIRDFNGDLIYKNLRLNLDKPDKATTCMWLFDKNGYYLRAVTHSNFYHRTAHFLDDEYYAILNLFPGVTGYTDYAWIVDNVNIEWLNQKPEYHVGSDKEFTTVIAMLTALADDPREKTVYIDPGVYDIFEEYGGADYMASLADTASSLNWRDVCKVVPPNTTIIGLGDVTLTWDASAADMQSASVAVLFSPLNVSGNCTIENIKVIGRNCRYAVHDETSGLKQYNGAIHHYKNCYFECLESTYNATTPYGSGHNKNMQLIFDNCEFVNYQNLAWSTHHQVATAVEKSTIIFNHCIFRCSRVNADFAVQFATDKANGLKDQVRFNDCYVAAKLKFYTTSASNVQQGYDVILIGSSHVDLVYSDNITTRYDVLQYNSFT